MAKYQNDSMLDAALAWLQARATRLTVCSTQPTTYTEAITTYKLADTTAVISSTEFTIGNGDTNGRKITVPAKSTIPVDASGTAAHVALVSTSGSTLLYVTTCTTQALTSGNTVDVPAFDIELADAA